METVRFPRAEIPRRGKNRASWPVGVAGLFIEIHEDPNNPPSDRPNMIPVDLMGALIGQLPALDELTKSREPVLPLQKG